MTPMHQPAPNPGSARLRVAGRRSRLISATLALVLAASMGASIPGGVRRQPRGPAGRPPRRSGPGPAFPRIRGLPDRPGRLGPRPLPGPASRCAAGPAGRPGPRRQCGQGSRGPRRARGPCAAEQGQDHPAARDGPAENRRHQEADRADRHPGLQVRRRALQPLVVLRLQQRRQPHGHHRPGRPGDAQPELRDGQTHPAERHQRQLPGPARSGGSRDQGPQGQGRRRAGTRTGRP